MAAALRSHPEGMLRDYDWDWLVRRKPFGPTPGVAVCSMFRDSQVWHGHTIDHVGRFTRAVTPQPAAAGLSAAYFLVEGNSLDDTRAALERFRADSPDPVHLLRHDVTGPPLGSFADPVRLANLSAIADTALRAARDSGAPLILWAESDLELPPDLLARLLDATGEAWWGGCLGVSAVPTCRGLFYDTWGFEGAGGEKWGTDGLAALRDYPGRYRPLRSAGTCLLLNGDNLRRHGLDCRGGCLPGLCAAGRAAGLTLWLDTQAEVCHPGSHLVAYRWI
jgi:hypothetical protein